VGRVIIIIIIFTFIKSQSERYDKLPRRIAVHTGVARNLLRGDKSGRLGTEVPSWVQGQNMETLKNTNGALTKTNLR